jgi:4-amino-4-deoxy-L-arabinose transferase-like glycosyltransferase
VVTERRRWLSALLLVALVLRLGWGLTRPTTDAEMAVLPDQREYLDLGRNLLHAGTLSFHDPRFDQTIYAYRTPGYPAFVALCGGSARAVRAVQAFVDTSTVLAVYLLARRWTPGVGPLAAAALVALNPLLIYFSGLVLSETLYTACLAWGVYLATLPRGWTASVLVLVFGVLVRPAGIGLVVLIPAVVAWANSGKPGAYVWRSALIRAGVAAAVLTIVLGLWAERNRRLLGQRVWLTTNEGITRYDGFNERADGSSNQWFVQTMPRLRDMDELQRNEVLSQMAASYISSHPERLGELAARKIARTWSPLPLSEQFGSAKYVVVGLAYTAPFFLLTLIGLWWGNLPRIKKVVLLTPALYFTAVHALSVGSLRYRVPAEPELATLAGAGVSFLLTFVSRGAARPRRSSPTDD